MVVTYQPLERPTCTCESKIETNTNVVGSSSRPPTFATEPAVRARRSKVSGAVWFPDPSRIGGAVDVKAAKGRGRPTPRTGRRRREADAVGRVSGGEQAWRPGRSRSRATVGHGRWRAPRQGGRPRLRAAGHFSLTSSARPASARWIRVTRGVAAGRAAGPRARARVRSRGAGPTGRRGSVRSSARGRRSAGRRVVRPAQKEDGALRRPRGAAGTSDGARRRGARAGRAQLGGEGGRRPGGPQRG